MIDASHDEDLLGDAADQATFGRQDIQGVAVQATSAEDVFSIGAAGSFGLFLGLSGGVSVGVINSDTSAWIGQQAQPLFSHALETVG